MTDALISVAEAADGVRYLTLDRPEKKNAISTTMRTEVLAALQAHDHDPDVRVTIIRGAGKAFCSGGDVSGMGGGSSETYSTEKSLFIFWSVRTLNRPLFLVAPEISFIGVYNGG